MADGIDNLGDLNVSVTGDFSELQAAIDQSVAVAEAGATKIADALQAVAESSGLAGGDLALLQSILEADAASGVTLAQSLADVAASAATVGAAVAGGASAALEQLNAAMAQGVASAQAEASALAEASAAMLSFSEASAAAGQYVLPLSAEMADVNAAMYGAGQQMSLFGEEAAGAAAGISQLPPPIEELDGSLAASSVALGGWTIAILAAAAAFLELVKNALEAKAQLELNTIAMTALTGSTETALAVLQQMRDLAASTTFSFQGLTNLAQQFLAIGESAERIPGIMQAIADDAAAIGGTDAALQQVGTSLERIADTGVLTQRQLTALRITWQDLADTMNTSAAEAKIAFTKGMLDATDAVDVATATIESKFGGLAEKEGEALSGMANALKTQTLGTLQDIGTALEPLALLITGALSTIVAGVDSLAKAWNTLPDWAKTTAGVLALNAALPGLGSALWAVRDAAAAAGTEEVYVSDTFDLAAAAANKIIKTQQDLVTALNLAKEAYANVQQQVKDNTADQDDLDRATNAVTAAFKAAYPAAAAAQKAAEQAAAAQLKMNAAFQDTASETLNLMDGMANGTVQASTLVSQLTKEIESADKSWDSLFQNSRDIVTEMLVPALQQAKAAVAQLAEDANLDAISDKILNIGFAADKVTAKLPADFQAMMDGVAKGINFQPMEAALNKAIADMKQQLATLPPALDASMQSGMQNDIAIWASAAGRLQDMLSALKLIGQDKSMEQLAQQVTGLVNVENAGQLSTDQWQAGLNGLATALTKSVIPAMQAGVAITPALVSALNSIPDIGPALAKAATEGIDPFTIAVQNMAEKTRAAFLTMDTAFKDLGVTSLDAATQAITKDGNDIIAILKNIGDASSLSSGEFINDEQALVKWANDVIGPMQNLGLTISDKVLAQIAKISPAMADAARTGPAALRIATDQMATDITLAVSNVTDAYKALGIQSAATMQQAVDKAQLWVDLLKAADAPMQAQVAASINLYQNELKFAQATGQSADNTLLLTQRLTDAKVKQQELTDATMGLSTLYTGIVNAMGTAWTSFEKGMGDAIVSGQNFGQAFDNVLTQLKKSLAELVVTYFGTMLKNAILENTDALGSFNKIFNSIFATAGQTMQVAGATAQQTGQILDSIAATMGQDATALTNAASSTAQGMTQAASTMNQATASIGKSVSSLVSDLSLIADVIGAIAGIIGDIEIARTNTLLGEIEVSTRGTLAQLISMQLTLDDIDARADQASSFEQSFWPGVMAEALTDLGEIVSEIAAGGFGGGGGSGSDAAALAVLLANLQSLSEQVTNLTENIGQLSTATSSQTAVDQQNVNNVLTNTGFTASNTSATAANTTATAASTSSVQNSTDAQGNLVLSITDATGAVTVWTESAQNAAAGLNTFTSNIAATADAEKALQNYLTQQNSATQNLTASTNVASDALAKMATTGVDTSTQVNEALASNIIAIRNQTNATATLTDAMATDITIVDSMGEAVTSVVQPLSQFQLDVNAVQQAIAQYDLAVTQGTQDLSSFIAAIRSAQAALQTLELGSLPQASQVQPAAPAGVTYPKGTIYEGLTTPLEDAVNSASVALTAALAAYQTALVTGVGDLTTLLAAVRTDEAAFSAAQVALDPATGAVPFSGSLQYGPGSSGYQSFTGPVNQYPEDYYEGSSGAGSTGGVNLNVTITGNSITSQALVDQLAQRVGAEIITNLRTRAGLKLG